MNLQRQVMQLSSAYVRKGGKDNRRQQRARMLAFAAHAEALGAYSLGQVGAVHVIRFWKAHREQSAATAYGYWLALCELWELAGKPGKPPRPGGPKK